MAMTIYDDGAMSSIGAITYTRYCKVYGKGQKSKVLGVFNGSF